MKSTCKGCERRRIGCHADCEEYRAYAEENRKKKAWLNEKNKVKLTNRKAGR